MLRAIDEIIDLLKNGEWHGVKEIADKTRLHEFKVELVTSFLAQYDFLEFNKIEKKIKLSPQLLLFLRKIEDAEQETVRRKRSLS